MKFDLHIHSKYSYDSLSEPERILRTAVKRNLDAISITDHNSMEVYAHLEPRSDIILIRGTEIHTDKGDLIGLFIEHGIQSRDFLGAVQEIRDQQGIVVLPHPYRRNGDPQELTRYVDLIEIFNPRSRIHENNQASVLCTKFQKMPIAGSDAHTCFEIGKARIEMDGCWKDPDEMKAQILSGERTIITGQTSYYLTHGLTFIMKHLKRRQDRP
jgi:predicted metal-dependent phosphoesterase TrpH